MIAVREVTEPQDPAITAFGDLQHSVYYAPETLIPASMIPSLLGRVTGERLNVLLVAESEGRVVGGSLFHAFRATRSASQVSWGLRSTFADAVLPDSCTSRDSKRSSASSMNRYAAYSSTSSVPHACRTKRWIANARLGPIHAEGGARFSGLAFDRWTCGISSRSVGQTAAGRRLSTCSTARASQPRAFRSSS